MEHNTWLIQRLKKPYPVKNDKASMLDKLANSMAFGGGLRNGGLRAEAMKLLAPIFSFDYMGSSEFEWGAVPEALAKIFKDRKNYIAHSMTIDMADVKENTWRRYAKKGEKLADKLKGTKVVYIFCHKADTKDVEELIKKLAFDKVDLKEVSLFSNALDPITDSDKATQGWLELDNGFMFFTDQDMFEKTVALFKENK